MTEGIIESTWSSFLKTGVRVLAYRYITYKALDVLSSCIECTGIFNSIQLSDRVGQYFNKLPTSCDQVPTIQLLYCMHLAFTILLPKQYLSHLAIIFVLIIQLVSILGLIFYTVHAY